MGLPSKLSVNNPTDAVIPWYFLGHLHILVKRLNNYRIAMKVGTDIHIPHRMNLSGTAFTATAFKYFQLLLKHCWLVD